MAASKKYDSKNQSEYKMVSIGPFKITLAAFITFVAGIFVAIALLFAGSIGPMMSLFTLFVFMILSYNVNCLQLGHCNIWAWFLTIVYVIYATFVLVVSVSKRGELSNVLSPGKVKVKGVRGTK